MMINGLTIGLVSAVLGILCGIIAVVMGSINEQKKEKELNLVRRVAIEKGLDAEAIKALNIAEPKEKKSYSALRWGCMLIGMAIAFVLLQFFSIDDLAYWFIAAGGLGVGLLVSFIIENHMEEKNAARMQQENPEA